MSARIIQLLVCLSLTLGLASNACAQTSPPATEALPESSSGAGSAADTAADTGATNEQASGTADDPASLDVEFDIGDMEDFDSEDFDLAAVDPEADAALQGLVQTVLLAAGAVLIALIGIVWFIRAKRKRG